MQHLKKVSVCHLKMLKEEKDLMKGQNYHGTVEIWINIFHVAQCCHNSISLCGLGR